MWSQARRKLVQAQVAVQDTFFSVKDVFENHKLVFTISTSILSAGAAWAGYAGRQLHQHKVEERLNSIENAMKSAHQLGEDEFKLLTTTGVSFKACFATAGTTLVLGYGLGWRGGRKFTLRRIQKQQQKQQQQKMLTSAGSFPRVLKKPFNALRLQKWRKEKLDSQEDSIEKSADGIILTECGATKG